MNNRVRTTVELRSGDDLLPAFTELKVIVENSEGVRGVGPDGRIHVVKPADYEPVPEPQEYNGAEVFLL